MKMILLNSDQANQVRGRYGTYSALDPTQVVEGYCLPLDVLTNDEFISIRELLLTLPQQEVTFIEPELPIEE